MALSFCHCLFHLRRAAPRCPQNRLRYPRQVTDGGADSGAAGGRAPSGFSLGSPNALSTPRRLAASWTSSGSATAIVESIRDLTKLRGEVVFVAVGSLPNDGKVIADVRDYS